MTSRCVQTLTAEEQDAICHAYADLMLADRHLRLGLDLKEARAAIAHALDCIGSVMLRPAFHRPADRMNDEDRA